MATNYPTTLDTTTQQPNISATDEMDDPGKLHDEVHTNHSQAIIQLEEKLGIGLSDATDASTNQILVKQADGSTQWAANPGVGALTSLSGAVLESTVNAKGDIYAATADDTGTRVGVGTTGQVLTADSTAATGLVWAAAESPIPLILALS